MVNRKHVFWQALLSAILIFAVGILLGFWIEHYRTSTIENLLLNSQVSVLDSQIMGSVNSNFNISCDESKQKIVQLADRIYSEANLLEDYEGSEQLTDTLNVIHRRYDLLRLMLWDQSTEIQAKCGSQIQTVVYFYKYRKPISIEQNSEQVAFSHYLTDLKSKYGNSFILIPIAGDMNLSSVDLVKSEYNVTSYPTIIVDNKYVIKNVGNLTQIDSIIAGNKSIS